MNKKGNVEAFLFLVFVVAIVGTVGLIMGFDYVPAGNVGVTNHLGTVGDRVLEPGVHWTGLLTNTVDFSTRVQKVSYAATAASKDLQTVKTQIALNFRVNGVEAPRIYKELGTDYQNTIIEPIVQEAIKAHTAKFNAEALVNQREEIKNAITDTLVTKLRDKSLMVTEVAITDFMFSESFDAAIEAKQVAEQEALQAENRLREMEFTAQAMELQQEVIEIKKLDIQREFIAKWNGNLPAYYVGGGNSPDLLMMLPTAEMK